MDIPKPFMSFISTSAQNAGARDAEADPAKADRSTGENSTPDPSRLGAPEFPRTS